MTTFTLNGRLVTLPGVRHASFAGMGSAYLGEHFGK